MLYANDELRHRSNGDPRWRDSVYWNFNEPDQEIGAWIYVWTLPEQRRPFGIIVSFYHGCWPDPDIYAKAMAAPGHRLESADRWIYCFQADGDNASGDYDNFEFRGLRVRRIEPLKRYELSFEDDAGNGFRLRSHFMTPPFDYADGANDTPLWLATNRYHRSHRITGELVVGGRRFVLDCTGDSDHSWGARDWSVFARNPFKMWSFQSHDGALSASFMDQGTDRGPIALGYVSIDGIMASAKAIRSTSSFDGDGVQRDIDVVVRDELDRTLHARCQGMHSLVGWGHPDQFWGFEGVGVYDVAEFGRLAGASSYFWPGRVRPADLRGRG